MGSARTPGPRDQEGNPFLFFSDQSPGSNGLNDRFDFNLLSHFLDMPVWARPTDRSRQWPFCPAEPRGPVGSIPLSSLRELIAEMNKACTIPMACAAPSAPRENLGPLAVPEGQVTFDAEGNDNPQSPYFSRVISWPGNAESGVTLGRGYDMGNRTEAAVTADLIKAGLAPDKAKAFAKGAGKKGQDARKFVKDNREKLGEITHEQQKALFNLIYPHYVKRAHEIYDLKTVEKNGKDLPGKVAWEKLDPPIRDILVDFVYQGFSGARPMQHGMKNDYDTLIDYIEGTPELEQYEAGRHRADYLRKRKPRKIKK